MLKTPGPPSPLTERIPKPKANMAFTVHYETINESKGIYSYKNYILEIMRACTTITEGATGVGAAGGVPPQQMALLEGFIRTIITCIGVISLPHFSTTITRTEFGRYSSCNKITIELSHRDYREISWIQFDLTHVDVIGN